MLFFVLLMDVVVRGLFVVEYVLLYWLCVVRWQQRRLGLATCLPAFVSCGLRGGLGGVCYD